MSRRETTLTAGSGQGRWNDSTPSLPRHDAGKQAAAGGGVRYACGCCEKVITETHWGRGKPHGEHPDHRYAQCGHSLTWFPATIVQESPPQLYPAPWRLISELDKPGLYQLADATGRVIARGLPYRVAFELVDQASQEAQE